MDGFLDNVPRGAAGDLSDELEDSIVTKLSADPNPREQTLDPVRRAMETKPGLHQVNYSPVDVLSDEPIAERRYTDPEGDGRDPNALYLPTEVTLDETSGQWVAHARFISGFGDSQEGALADLEASVNKSHNLAQLRAELEPAARPGSEGEFYVILDLPD